MIILDTESYPNYFLAAFLQLDTGKVRTFELYGDEAFDAKTINAILRKHTTISFNGLSYDLPMLAYAVNGATAKQLNELSNQIIKSNLPAYKICKQRGISIPKTWNHIDLIEVAPGQSSLKIYGGRLHCPTMQDLPYDPAEQVDEAKRKELVKYCVNDLRLTELLYNTLKAQIELRVEMGKEYGLDLRSKSDAQIAETVITSELSKLTGDKYSRPEYPDGYTFKYRDPLIIKFESPDLNRVYQRIMREGFRLGDKGSVIMPEWLKDERIVIGGREYQMGIGGLHSCESRQLVRAREGWKLADFDVAAYYPSIILQQRIAPRSMGEQFLRVYQSLVNRRIRAKREGNKVTDSTIKIVINGSFGKLGSKWSALYAPDLLIQTTITGQLALLMLIERVTEVGGQVVSANTDGIVVLYPERLEATLQGVMWDWMLDTSYELERTGYRLIASANVNNYVAVKPDGKVKTKGWFASGGLSKNPENSIVYHAVAQFLAHDTPLEQTIRACSDIRQLLTVRKVTGGALWRGEAIGKAVRYYHSSEIPVTEEINYAKNGNKVPNSSGVRPCMVLPEAIPKDIDYKWYIVEAEKLLCEVGYVGT